MMLEGRGSLIHTSSEDIIGLKYLRLVSGCLWPLYMTISLSPVRSRSAILLIRSKCGDFMH